MSGARMCQSISDSVKQMIKSVQQSRMKEGSKTATLLPQETGGSLERMKKDINDLHEGRNIGNRCNCNKKYRSGIVSRAKAGKDYELGDKKLDFCTRD